MSAVLIELSKERYWGLTEARRSALGILADTYRRATPIRIVPPASAGGAGWSLAVHAEDEPVMRGLVEAAASGTSAYLSPEALRNLLRTGAAR
jgi:hypothetical protein